MPNMFFDTFDKCCKHLGIPWLLLISFCFNVVSTVSGQLNDVVQQNSKIVYTIVMITASTLILADA